VPSAKELLASTSLRPEERVALEAAIPRLREEPGHDESDVDLMVITRGGDLRDWQRVWQIVFDAADDAEARPSFFSVQVHDPAWLEQRTREAADYEAVRPSEHEAAAAVQTAERFVAAVQAMLANP
jgi:hypothetical protein